MRYAQIRNMDISNGESIGVALFVQGCHFRCDNCFNSEAWDFKGGYEWTKEITALLLKLLNKPYIKRITILGGEPLADENIEDVLKLVKEIRASTEYKNIWIYSGYTWDQIMYPIATNNFDSIMRKRQETISIIDVLVDGKYINRLKDLNLQWRGSSNQRVIDIKKSLKEGCVVLYCD